MDDSRLKLAFQDLIPLRELCQRHNRVVSYEPRLYCPQLGCKAAFEICKLYNIKLYIFSSSPTEYARDWDDMMSQVLPDIAFVDGSTFLIDFLSQDDIPLIEKCNSEDPHLDVDKDMERENDFIRSEKNCLLPDLDQHPEGLTEPYNIMRFIEDTIDYEGDADFQDSQAVELENELGSILGALCKDTLLPFQHSPDRVFAVQEALNSNLDYVVEEYEKIKPLVK